MIPSFHILIATGGRSSLQWMLKSLKDQLTEKDAITIIFDGEGSMKKSGFESSWIEGHLSKITIIENFENLGYWGHAIRNKYQGCLSKTTTFIMHADDDDIYYGNAFDRLRYTCVDPNTLYIASVCTDRGIYFPDTATDTIQLYKIGTPCGIIPFNLANKSTWLYHYGGDFYYYKILSHFIKDIEFIHGDPIYKINPDQSDLLHLTSKRE